MDVKSKGKRGSRKLLDLLMYLSGKKKRTNEKDKNLPFFFLFSQPFLKDKILQCIYVPFIYIKKMTCKPFKHLPDKDPYSMQCEFKIDCKFYQVTFFWGGEGGPVVIFFFSKYY